MKNEKAAALVARAYALENEADTKALYRDWAGTYDKSMLDELGYLTPAKTAGLLADHVEDRNALVLDIGSGTGLAGQELVTIGFTRLHALDYSADMLEVAAKRGIYKSLIEADLNQKLRPADDTYDAMICTGTFTHAHVNADCLDELFRILKPGGIFACTIHKDIREQAGFNIKLSALAKAGILKTLHQQTGQYFSTGPEKEGWYIVWQKTTG